MSVRARSRWVAALVFAAAGPALAGDPAADTVNKPTAPVTLTAVGTGKPVTVGPAPAGGAATVVVFLSFDCPVSNSYAPVLNDLAARYAGKGVAVYGVVGGDEPADAVRARAAEFELAFPVLADPAAAAAAAFQAQTVAEAFVLDRQGVLRYRGRIDDGYSARLKRNARVTSHDLRDAVDAVLAGAAVKVPVTVAVGCPVGRPEVAAKPGPTAAVTYHKDVEPILQNNCQSCHRPGQAGPFSLLSYKQAVTWAGDVKAYTADRRMPPWKPAGGPGYANDRAMAAADVATLAAWVDAGCPEGDPKDAPPPKAFPAGWQLGPPDLVLTVPESFHVGPAGKDLFRCFVLPTGLTEDKSVVGYEVRPGNPRVVHHTLNFYDTSGRGRDLADAERKRKKKADEQDTGPGYSVGMGVGFVPGLDPKRPLVPSLGGLGGWAPGQRAATLPAGAGFFLPRGADLIVQTHYHRTGRPEDDQLSVGLYFAKGPVGKQFQSLAVRPPRETPRQLNGPDKPTFLIPANAPAHTITGAVTLSADATLYSVMPHMHLLGRTIKVTLTPPGGEPVTLVDIPAWDYNWQETYWFKTPIPAKAGTRLEVVGVYDNSPANPHNPSTPPKDVRFGEQTTNEMLFGFVGLTAASGNVRVRGVPADPVKAAK